MMPKEFKEKIKVAFQGERGDYSQEAAFEFFGENIETIPCQAFKNVFELVERGKANFGIIPIENSLEGTIGQNYDLLKKSKLKIFGEQILKIRHCLIANQGVKMEEIKRVYSHPQALGQCRKFLEKKGSEVIPFYDTAGSVKMIKEKKLRDSAAIASEIAAKIYEMEILKKNIQTNHLNFTRFFILSKKEAPATKNDKTVLIFSIRHLPGALFKALRPFDIREINLTKIESRPIIGRPWEYDFILEFEGNRKDKKIKRALKDLKKVTTFLKIISSYSRN